MGEFDNIGIPKIQENEFESIGVPNLKKKSGLKTGTTDSSNTSNGQLPSNELKPIQQSDLETTGLLGQTKGKDAVGEYFTEHPKGEPFKITDYLSKNKVSADELGIPKGTNLNRELRPGDIELYNSKLEHVNKKKADQQAADARYLEGFIKSVNQATSTELRAVGVVENFARRAISAATGIDHGTAITDQLADYVYKNSVENLANTPNDIMGTILNSLGAMTYLPIEMSMPEMRLGGAISKATLGVVECIPKLPVVMGGKAFLTAKSEGKTTNEAGESMVNQAILGTLFHGIGGIAGKAGQVVAEKTNSVLAGLSTSTVINVSGFAGLSALYGGNTKDIISSGLFGIWMATPDFLNAVRVKGFDNLSKLSPMAIREIKNSNIDPIKLKESQIDNSDQKNTIENILTTNAVVQDIKTNAQNYIDAVHKSTIDPEQKKILLNKIAIVDGRNDIGSQIATEIKSLVDSKANLPQEIDPIQREAIAEGIDEQINERKKSFAMLASNKKSYWVNGKESGKEEINKILEDPQTIKDGNYDIKIFNDDQYNAEISTKLDQIGNADNNLKKISQQKEPVSQIEQQKVAETGQSKVFLKPEEIHQKIDELLPNATDKTMSSWGLPSGVEKDVKLGGHGESIEKLWDKQNAPDNPKQAVQESGIVKFAPKTVDMAVKPTDELLNLIEKKAHKSDGEYELNINGEKQINAQYEKGTDPKKITSDIKKYFDTGEIPENWNDLTPDISKTRTWIDNVNWNNIDEGDLVSIKQRLEQQYPNLTIDEIKNKYNEYESINRKSETGDGSLDGKNKPAKTEGKEQTKGTGQDFISGISQKLESVKKDFDKQPLEETLTKAKLSPEEKTLVIDRLIPKEYDKVVDDYISKLDKKKIDCPPVAKFGLTTEMKEGGNWSIVEDLQGEPSHKEGGTDVEVKGKEVEAEGGEVHIKSDNGTEAIIPKKYRYEVLGMIHDKCHSCIDKMVSGLPKEKDFAGDGSEYDQVDPDKVKKGYNYSVVSTPFYKDGRRFYPLINTVDLAGRSDVFEVGKDTLNNPIMGTFSDPNTDLKLKYAYDRIPKAVLYTNKKTGDQTMTNSYDDPRYSVLKQFAQNGM